MFQTLVTEGASQVRHRTASVGVMLTGTGNVGDSSTLPEEINLDYIEIASIPPLPLYALINVDSNTYTSQCSLNCQLYAEAAQNLSFLCHQHLCWGHIGIALCSLLWH